MNKLKGFWPLPGGIKNYVNTLSRILLIIKENNFTKEELISWLVREYSLKNEKLAKSYFDAAINKTGLIEIKNGKLILNSFGLRIKHSLER